MVYTLGEIAERIGADIKGDKDIKIYGVGDAAIQRNFQEGYIYYVESRKVLRENPEVKSSSAVLTTSSLKDHFSNALYTDKEIRLLFIELLRLFEKEVPYPKGISSLAYIHPTVKLGNNVTIMAHASIMEGVEIEDDVVIYPGVVIEPYAKIGKGTILKPNVVIGAYCIIGKHVIIHANSVIGADGFGYYDDKSGERHKIPQIGNVIIGDYVELGAGVTIDRATIDSTRVGDHTKIDDQVHIGHNCQFGRYIYVAGNAGISGSVIAEDYVIIAGQAGIADHVHLKEGTIIYALTGVPPGNYGPKKAYFGIPAREAREAQKITSSMRYLPDLLKRVKEIEKKLEEKK